MHCDEIMHCVWCLCMFVYPDDLGWKWGPRKSEFRFGPLTLYENTNIKSTFPLCCTPSLCAYSVQIQLRNGAAFFWLQKFVATKIQSKNRMIVQSAGETHKIKKNQGCSACHSRSETDSLLWVMTLVTAATNWHSFRWYSLERVFWEAS